MAGDATPHGASPGNAPSGEAGARPPGSPRPRAFPLSKLAVSAVGIAAGAWLWLGSGWRWDVTPAELARGQPPLGLGSWNGRHVRLVGARPLDGLPVGADDDGTGLRAFDGEDGTPAFVRGDAAGSARPSGRAVRARAGGGPFVTIIDAARGRWNSRAVAAVVVVLWGIAHGGASVYVWRERSRAQGPRGRG